jgi:hypothetical protein
LPGRSNYFTIPGKNKWSYDPAPGLLGLVIMSLEIILPVGAEGLSKFLGGAFVPLEIC